MSFTQKVIANKKFFTIIFLMGLCLNSSFSQDKKWVTISTNPVRAYFNEYFVEAEYKFKAKSGCGLSFGYVHPNSSFEVFKLSPSQNDYPGLVYNGFAMRVNYQYSAINSDYFEFYLSPQFLYKRLWYNNMEFWDSWGDSDNNWYTRDEKTNLYGLDFMMGWNFYPGIKEFPVKAFINLRLGFGIRWRERQINNIESRVQGNPDLVVKLGKEYKSQAYIVPLNALQAGFRIDLK